MLFLQGEVSESFLERSASSAMYGVRTRPFALIWVMVELCTAGSSGTRG